MYFMNYLSIISIPNHIYLNTYFGFLLKLTYGDMDDSKRRLEERFLLSPHSIIRQ